MRTGLMKKIGAAVGTLGLSSILLIAPASPASATHTCVDNYEYNHTYVGDLKRPLEYFYDTTGWTAAYGGGVWVKKYYACGSYYDIVKIRYVRTAGEWRVSSGTRF